jgi:hypothetical protein
MNARKKQHISYINANPRREKEKKKVKRPPALVLEDALIQTVPVGHGGLTGHHLGARTLLNQQLRAILRQTTQRSRRTTGGGGKGGGRRKGRRKKRNLW